MTTKKGTLVEIDLRHRQQNTAPENCRGSLSLHIHVLTSLKMFSSYRQNNNPSTTKVTLFGSHVT